MSEKWSCSHAIEAELLRRSIFICNRNVISEQPKITGIYGPSAEREHG